MNRLFTAWCERVYHARPHSETGQPPIRRWLAGAPFPVPDPARLREAFLWAEHRVVRKDATLSLFGGPLPGQRPVPGRAEGRSASSTRLTCRCWRSAGTGGPTAPPFRSRPAATPTRRRSPSSRAPRRAPTGIDYLGLHPGRARASRAPDRIRYDALAAGEDARTRTRRRAAGDRRPGRAGQRRPRLGRPALRRQPRGRHRRDRRLPHRQGRRPGAIAAERAAGGWSPEDAEAARGAAARARQAADAAALAAAAGITTLEDR